MSNFHYNWSEINRMNVMVCHETGLSDFINKRGEVATKLYQVRVKIWVTDVSARKEICSAVQG